MKTAQLTRIPTWQDKRDSMRRIVIIIVTIIAWVFLMSVNHRIVSLERRVGQLEQQASK